MAAASTTRSGNAYRGSPMTGFYWIVFVVIEPILTYLGAAQLAFNTKPFFYDLIPGTPTLMQTALDARTTMVLWQLGSCFFLIALIGTFVYNTIPRAVPTDWAAQEKLYGALIAALAIADVTHVGSSLYSLPGSIRYDLSKWNIVVHGNTSMTAALFVLRLAWLSGIGRPTYAVKAKKK